MPDTLFNIWDESVTDGPGTQTGVVVGAFPVDGYVLGRRDPATDRFYFGLDSDEAATQKPSFVPEGWSQRYETRTYSHYIEDADIGDVVLTFTRGSDEVHFVTVQSGESDATVLVFKYGAESPGKYTVDTGSADASLCTFAWSKGQQKIEYISEGVTSPYTVMLGEVETFNSFQVTATVGRATPPEWGDTWRYEDVSGETVFPVVTQPDLAATVSNATKSSHPVYVGMIIEVRNNNGDVDLIEHNTHPYWKYNDYSDDSSHWEHLVRVTYKTGEDGLGDVYAVTHIVSMGVTVTGGVSLQSYQTPPVLDEGEMFDLPSGYHHVSGNLYVKFGDTGWEFGWFGGEDESFAESTFFESGKQVDYPDELQRVVGSTTYNYTMDAVIPSTPAIGPDVIVGPLVSTTTGPTSFLFTLQPMGMHGPPIEDYFYYTDPWNVLSWWREDDPNDVTVTQAIPLTYKQVGVTNPAPLLAAGASSEIVLHSTSPVSTMDDLYRAPRVVAAASWLVENPLDEGSVSNLSVLAQTLELLENEAADIDITGEEDDGGTGGGGGGSVDDDALRLSATVELTDDLGGGTGGGGGGVTPEVDITASFTFSLITDVDLSEWHEMEDVLAPSDAVSLDAGCSVVVWTEFADFVADADHDFDAEVALASWYEIEDVPISSESQLRISALVSGDDWYVIEDITVEVTTNTEVEATVSVSDPVVVDNLTVLTMTEFDASVMIVSVGESTGEPPPPGTCLSGEFTVTLPAGADPEIPLTYVVDGRLVQVWHDGVVLDTFYLLTPDLEDFCVNVVSSSGNPLPELPDPDVQQETPTYMIDTSMQQTDVFLKGDGDFVGTVFVGPNVLIDADNNVEVTWDVASPDDLDGKRVVWLFGYENPPIGFEDAALIAESGNGKYLRAVLPAL